MGDFPLIEVDEVSDKTLLVSQSELTDGTLDENLIDRLPKKNKRQRLSEGTRQRYKAIIRDFNQFLSDNRLSVSQKSLMQYFNALESKLQPATLNLHKSALVKCIKAQMGGNSILKNLAIEKAFELIEVYKPDRSVSSGDCVTEKKIKAMVENAPSKKTGLIIQFLYKTGCRVGEMINIRLSDCELINGYMRIRIIGKGKKVRKITIPLELYREVRREYGGKTWLFESRGGNPLNRDNVGYQIRKAAKRIGLENFHTHLIRHSRATDMLKHKEITLTAVSKFLGHASVATTAEMYVHDEVNYHELFSKDSI